MLRIVLITLTFIFSFQLSAGKIEKAFACLDQLDYFQAKKLFEKELIHLESPASYGLAIIYFQKNNPYHNYDSAYRYILISESSYSKLTEKQIVHFYDVGLSMESISELKNYILKGLFEQVKSSGKLEAYNQFIHLNPSVEERNVAILKRDSIIFYDAISKNTSSYYDSILQHYPSIIYKNQLVEKRELAFYTENTIQGNTIDFVNFVINNPFSPHVNDAQDRIFDLETMNHTIPEYLSFVKRFPSYHNVKLAWERIYQSYMVEYSDDRVKQFKKEYPDFPFKDLLKRDMELVKLMLYPYKKDSLFGWMDHEGNVKSYPRYHSLNFFSEGLSLAQKNGAYGYIDKMDNIVIPFQYDFASDFSNGRAIVEVGGKSGLINRSGKLILPLEFSEIVQVSTNLFAATKDSLYALYDLMGKNIVAESFDDVFPNENGYIKFKQNGKTGFLNLSGNIVIPPNSLEQFFYSDSLIVFKDSILFGIKDLSNKILIKPQYEMIYPLLNGRAIFLLSHKFGYLDEKGNKIIKNTFDPIPNYGQLCNFKDGFAKVKIKGKFGIIDSKGKYYVNPEYFGMGDIGTLISFTKGKQWGYFKLEDKSLAVQPIFDFAYSFHSGLAIVDVKGLQGLINEKAKWIIPSVHKIIKAVNEETFIFSDGEKFGLINSKGDVILEMVYSQIRPLNKDLLLLNLEDDVKYFHLIDSKIIQLAISKDE